MYYKQSSLLIYFILMLLYNATHAQISFEINNIGDSINSPYAELNPIISADGNRIYFVRSNHPMNSNPLQGQDIWMSRKDKQGNWTNAVNLGAKVNKQQYNTLFYVSPNGEKMLIGGSYKDGVYWGVGFSFIEYKNGAWGEPYEIEIKKFDAMNNGNFSSAYLLPNNKTLLLSFSEIIESSSNNLYVSLLQPNGLWSVPKPLGNKINTAYDESTPFMAADGVTLYFSSNRTGGYGHNDVYMSKRLDNTWQNWSEPVNLGPEINSEQWDGYYTIPANGNVAYMSSYHNTKGKADIVEIKLQTKAKPEPVALVSGKVINKETQTPVEAEIIYEELPSENEAGKTSFWSNSGTYQLLLPNGKNYGIVARAAGFFPLSAQVNLKQSEAYSEVTKNLEMVPIKTGQSFTLNNLFFQEYSDVINDDSKPELNRLVKMLKDNPSTQIEIAGHTDAVGSETDNQLLSEKRAKAVKNYLISKGIKPNRLKDVGYGETQPVSDNNNDIDREKNRRVEIKIL